MKLILLLAPLLLSVSHAAEPVDFDGALDLGAVLREARRAAVGMPAARGAAVAGGIRVVTDSKELFLEPGLSQSAYVTMESTAYREVCDNDGPWTGPNCRDEVMFRETRRFKLVSDTPIPLEWGRQTFRVRLDVSSRPSLRIESVDLSRSWEYVLPELGEDILKIKPASNKTVCTLRGIERDQCVYSCPDGREIRRPIAEPGNDDTPTIACPQILIPR